SGREGARLARQPKVFFTPRRLFSTTQIARDATALRALIGNGGSWSGPGSSKAGWRPWARGGSPVSGGFPTWAPALWATPFRREFWELWLALSARRFFR